MSFDLKRAVDIVRDDMKGLYKNNPGGLWRLPFIVLHMNGETVELPVDRIMDMSPEEGSIYMAGWLNHHRDKKRIEAVVVGRQVVKLGGVLDASGNPTVKEKGIMVSGYSFATKRKVLSVTPTREFIDHRSQETIQKEGMLPNPALDAPDAVKILESEKDGSTKTLICQFGDEQRHDSQLGGQFTVDPIIEGVIGMQQAATELSAPGTESDTTVYDALKKLRIGPLDSKGGA